MTGASGIMRIKERVIHGVLLFCALVSLAMTAGIIWVLSIESLRFFSEVSPIEFLFGGRWAPLLEPKSFGVLSLVCGTFLVAGGALLVAVSIGLGSGIFLSEYAPPSVRSVVKQIHEVVAGILTVVYGYFALVFVTPRIIQPLVPSADIFNAASAAISA